VTPLVLLGGGGHAAVIAESARRAGFRLVAVASAAPVEAGGPFEDPRSGDPRLERLGDPADPAVVARIEALVREGSRLHAAVGDAMLRDSWRLCFGHLHPAAFASMVDPTAVVSPSADVAPGAYVGVMAVVQARASIGRGAIVNTRAIVEHDCRLGDDAHLAPGAILCGGVTVGAGVIVGAGAVVLPGRSVGARAIVGAGAVVARDVPSDASVKGVPAR